MSFLGRVSSHDKDGEIRRLETELKSKQKEIDTLDKDKQNYLDDIKQLQKTQVSHEKTIDEKNKEIQKIQNNLIKTKHDLMENNNLVEQLKKEIEIIKKDNYSWSIYLNENKKVIEKQKEEIESLKSQLQSYKDRANDYTTKYIYEKKRADDFDKVLTIERTNFKYEKVQLKKRNEDLEDIIKQHQNSCKSFVESSNVIIQKMKNEITQITNEKNKLEKNNSELALENINIWKEFNDLIYKIEQQQNKEKEWKKNLKISKNQQFEAQKKKEEIMTIFENDNKELIKKQILKQVEELEITKYYYIDAKNDIEEKLDKNEKKIKEMKSERDCDKSTITKLEKENKECLKKVELLEKEVEVYKQKIEKSQEDLKIVENAESQQSHNKENVIKNQKIKIIPLEVPMAIFHFGGTFTHIINETPIEIAIEAGTAEPHTIIYEKDGVSHTLQISSQKVEGTEKRGFDLIKTVWVDKQFVGQSVTIFINIDILKENYNVPVVVPDTQTSYNLGELGFFNKETQKRGNLVMILKIV
ncbi:GRIP domain containing protein RUD3, putative [Entamoeba invadens IP1]|uniref:GRIP domain containing protein RUD3, putative n=1 Tax=Entamoeba invadens IP1 TaxID=370355 RepID=L7FNU8_ENTIV|nr:GRIP domain containing protein RUD3, putative [Entamoeba invadens IP1]ELP88923.1 GRIP domain containing protein RUD3, putative [Entamoeba invadens IP1]|eukprot:XP_004255694.1 GRIP domain containing protein RUD3, putative [Entamoeba invadens IP1]